MALKDYVKFNTDFRNSVNLYLDLNKIEKLNSYIFTKSSIDILGQYVDSVIDNKQQSTLLIGPYGKGKSHLLLLLLAALSMPRSKENDSAMRNLTKRIGKVNSQAGAKFGEVCKGKRYLPVLITSTQGDLNQAFLIGLNEALKRNSLTELAPETFYTYAVSMITLWQNEYPKTYTKFQELLKEKKRSASDVLSALRNCDAEALEMFREIYPKLTSGSVFNPLVASEVLPMYKNIADKLVEEYDYAGIYIVFDEFSKYIEGQNNKSAGNNMKLLQDMCELANASKSSKIFLTMVAHKSVKEYGKYLSAETINSFTGIEGRIKEVLFVTSSKNNYELIQNAIRKDDDCFSDPNISIHVDDNVVAENYRLAAFSEFTKKDFKELVVKGCYPLSPTSAYLLLNVSEKVAQNERTLFTFISKEEQYSMAKAVKTMSASKRWIISADLIYDYFKDLFKKDVANEYIHNEWLNAEYALGEVSDQNQVKMLKTIAVINIVNKMDEMPADFSTLHLAADVPDSNATLEELCGKGLIYKKGSNNCYVFKTRATSELKSEIKRRVKIHGDRANANQVFADVSDVQYILPKHYNLGYAMTRYFVYEYMSAEEFLDIDNLEVLLEREAVCDGKVLALYSKKDIDYSARIEKKLKSGKCERLVVIYSTKQMLLEPQIQEYEIIQELKRDKFFFAQEENKVLLKELPIIEEDLQREIGAYLDVCFDDGADKYVFYFTRQKLKVENRVRLSDVADLICSSVYSYTMAINNELINKENILTAPIKKVRKTIIEKLLNGDSFEEYLCGTSAEATIYRALFVGTGIRQNDYAKNVERVLMVFEKFIVGSCDKKQSLSLLVDELTSVPFGMRRGVIPIYLAYSLSLRREDIVIYFDKKEMQLNADIILNMCERPQEYSIFISLEDVMKEKYIDELCALYRVPKTENLTDSRLQNILIAMQRWFRALPQVTKNIKHQEEYMGNAELSRAFPRVRSILQNVEANPYEALFVELPKAFSGGEDLEHIAKLLSELKMKLAGYYDWMTQKAVSKTIEVFDKSGKKDLNHALREWYDKQSSIAKQGLHSSQITGLMNTIDRNKLFDDGELVKKVIHAVTDIYLDSWNDTSIEEYLDTLQHVKEQIERMSDDHSSVGNLELSFVGKSGKTITRYYEPISEGTGAILKNILSDTLDDFSDLSVNDKVAILLEMIEKELG